MAMMQLIFYTTHKMIVWLNMLVGRTNWAGNAYRLYVRWDVWAVCVTFFFTAISQVLNYNREDCFFSYTSTIC
jgi:hypothetical protein